MKKNTLILMLLGLAVPLLSSMVFCQSFWVDQDLMRMLAFGRGSIGFGARAAAMGGAFTALADDITAMSYNPAGLAQIIKPEVSVGANYGGLSTRYPGLSLSSGSWTAIQVEPYNPRSSALAFDYAGLAIPFRVGGIPIVVGLAYQNRISNALRADFVRTTNESGYTEDPAMDQTDGEDFAYHNTGGISTATFSIALRPLDFLHIGGNINMNRMTLTDSLAWLRETTVYLGGAEFGQYSTKADYLTTYKVNRGISYDLGVLLKFKIFSLGATYKSGWHASLAYSSLMNVSGNDLSGYEWSDTFSEELKGELHWPRAFNAGVALQPIDALTIAFDYNFTQWSRGQITWDGYLPLGFPMNEPADARTLRAGLEYLAFWKNFAMPIRIGGFRDRLIGPDASGIPITFWGATFGTGIAVKDFVVDVAGVYNFGAFDAAPNINLPDGIVRAKSSNWRVILSVSLRLGVSRSDTSSET